MQIIDKLCNKVSAYIASEMNFDKEKKEVVNYGIFAIVQMSICIGLVIIFGAVLNVLYESLIISFVISILRKSSGGAHASSPEKCAVMGTIVSIIMALVSKNINIDLKECIVIGIIVFIYAFYYVVKLAPVDSKEKPISKVSKRNKLKKMSIWILIFYIFLIFLNVLLCNITHKKIFISYSVCVYMGIVWQVFSLTKYGHRLLGILGR